MASFSQSEENFFIDLRYSAAQEMAKDGFAMRYIRSALNRLSRELSYPFIRYMDGFVKDIQCDCSTRSGNHVYYLSHFIFFGF